MERRDLFKAASALALGALVTSARADEHAHHHDHGSTRPYADVATAAGNCVQAGEVCLAHCLVLLGEGDKTMAGCAKAVNDMLALCAALQKLANQGSAATPRLAKLAGDLCADCEKECRKHEKEHAECKACADACAACGKECQKLAA